MPTMKILRLTQEDYHRGDWSGGSTTQLYIYPPGSDYAARRFALRVSSATVNVPESDFTPLPNVTRYITPLTGGFTLIHPDAQPVTMRPLDKPYRFSGDMPTHCVGTATDFNLMLKGIEGEMEICRDSGAVLPGLNCFYPLEEVRFCLNGEEYPMNTGELLVVFAGEPAVLTASGGQFIRCFGAVGADEPA